MTASTTRRRVAALTVLLTLFGVLAIASPARAATLVVDDDLVDCPLADHTTVQDAVDAAASGDTITVCPGTYAENVLIGTDDLTISGAGAGATTLTSASGLTIKLTASGLALSGVTVDGQGTASQGLRVEDAGGTVADLTVDGVAFTDYTSQGIELHNATTIVDMVVTNTTFSDVSAGIRSSSGTAVQGLDVTDSVFEDNVYGLYHAGSLDYDDVVVTDSTFTDNAYSGLYVENLTNALLSGNDLTSNAYGIVIYNPSDSVTNVTIEGNNIAGNTSGGFWTAGHSDPIEASCNWWGADSGPSGDEDGTGDALFRNGSDVNVVPWLRAPAPGGPCTGGLPTPDTKNDCKKGGWMSLYDDEGTPFKNQGDCVSYVATGGKNKADG